VKTKSFVPDVPLDLGLRIVSRLRRRSMATWMLVDSSAAEAQPSRDLEQAFDRLNPDYGVPADTHNADGQEAVRDREAALLLGTRVAVATSRENDPNPVMWLAGQDYRAADATHRARVQTIRQRYGPERPGPER
jgi:hypothetical protein